MSPELRVQHLEELVSELRQQVADLQSRFDRATSRSSSFDLVQTAPSEAPRFSFAPQGQPSASSEHNRAAPRSL